MARTGSLRLLVEMDASGNEGELALRRAVESLGGTATWHVERLFTESPDSDEPFFIVSTTPSAPISPQAAFALAYALAAADGVAHVEPDLPIDQYPGLPPQPAVGAFPEAPPTPADLRWAREEIWCPQAWLRKLPAGGAARGRGVLIGHPDTGYTRHFALGPNLEALDLVHDRDFVDDDDDAADPLESGFLPLTQFPGHGTGTSSVIVGRGDDVRGVVGIAPEAVLVPLRAVNSVIQLFDSDVARAVDRARSVGCHVVSMSLGGKGFFGLHRAIQKAVDAGMIVMAAAGNQVHIVTAPASYDNCIAVAATRRDHMPWTGSSRGKDVEISAPGSEMFGAAWHLDTNPKEPFVSVKHGTSFAVAHVAGAAALWLAFHGPTGLAPYPGASRQAAFRALIRDVAHWVPPVEWDASKYGPGILNADALLGAELPDPASVAGAGAFAAEPPQGAARIAKAFGDLDDDGVAARLQTVGVPDADLDRFAPELLYHLMADARLAEEFAETPPAAPGAFAPEWVGRLRWQASGPLAAALN